METHFPNQLPPKSNTEQMMSRMQKVVNKLEKWGEEIDLKFNALKTEVL